MQSSKKISSSNAIQHSSLTPAWKFCKRCRQTSDATICRLCRIELEEERKAEEREFIEEFITERIKGL